eukprot:365555-Chlamydomonas_euryale.AAC.14
MGSPVDGNTQPGSAGFESSSTAQSCCPLRASTPGRCCQTAHCWAAWAHEQGVCIRGRRGGPRRLIWTRMGCMNTRARKELARRGQGDRGRACEKRAGRSRKAVWVGTRVATSFMHDIHAQFTPQFPTRWVGKLERLARTHGSTPVPPAWHSFRTWTLNP